MVRTISLVVALWLIYTLGTFAYSRIESSPYSHQYVSAKKRVEQLDCLTQNIYYEASNQSFEGRVAVAQVTLNRTKSSKFPNDVCSVVFQDSQFSWTISKPKSLVRINKQEYNESYEVAKMVLLEGFRLPSIKDANFYHADYIKQPVWARNMKRVAKIGNHIFYKG